MSPLVKLVSSDGHEFAVEPKIARMSATIAHLMETMNMNEENEETFDNHPIPLHNVKKDQLEKLIEWCEHHKNDVKVDEKEEDEQGSRKAKPPHVVPEWDKQFIGKLEDASVCRLFEAANYLDVRDLFNHCSQTIADIMHGMKTDEMRKRFNIPCDLTAAEIKQIKKNNAWCEE